MKTPKTRKLIPVLSDQDRNWYILKGYEIRETPFCRVWYLNGEFHRLDGLAVEWSTGDCEWYLNGRPVTEKEHRIAGNETIKNGIT